MRWCAFNPNWRSTPVSEKAVKIITVENVHASIWRNEGGAQGIYHTASFSKSYIKDDVRHFTTSFGGFDLAHLITVASMSIAWMWTENRKRNRKTTSKKKSTRRKANRQSASDAPEPPPPI